MSEDPTRIESGYDNTDLFAPVEQTVKHVVMDDLRAELAQKIRNEPIVLVVPNRPNFSIRFDTNIDYERLQAWVKRSTKKVGNKEEQDGFRLACLVIANQAEALIYKGQDATDDEGAVLNFRNPALATLLGVVTTSPILVIRTLYGSDGHIARVMEDVLTAAGYDADIVLQGEEEDPTRMS